MEIMQGLKTRVFDNKKSSLIGLGLLVVGCIALLLGKATLTELGGFALTISGLFFIYTQDSILKINPK